MPHCGWTWPVGQVGREPSKIELAVLTDVQRRMISDYYEITAFTKAAADHVDEDHHRHDVFGELVRLRVGLHDLLSTLDRRDAGDAGTIESIERLMFPVRQAERRPVEPEPEDLEPTRSRRFDLANGRSQPVWRRGNPA